MPLEKEHRDSMIGPYDKLLDEVEKQGIKSGEHYRKMKKALKRMHQLADESANPGEYYTKSNSENLASDFSSSYAKAAHAHYLKADYDDDTLLKNTVKQYEQALVQTASIGDPANVAGIYREILTIGKSGVSYPVFLTRCEEKGLFERLRCPDQTPLLEKMLETAKKMLITPTIEMNRAMLDRYRELKKKSPLGIVDPLVFELESFRITNEYQPKIRQWDAIGQHMYKLADTLLDWMDSFCFFAPFDFRWASATAEETAQRIEMTQQCNPGFLKVRESIFKEYFNLTMSDMWNHEIFINGKKTLVIPYVEPLIDMIREAYPYCKEGGRPPANVIAAREQFHNSKKTVSRKSSINF
jgi:hypothetical protein